MMNTLIEYLKRRKVSDLDFVDFITSNFTKQKEFKLFSTSNQDYMISHFFDESNTLGFSLIMTNDILGIDKTNMVAIAAVEGDDIICLNAADNSVWLWCLQTGNGEYVKISDTFKTFAQMIT